MSALLIVLFSLFSTVSPLLLYGCTLTDNLCEGSEYCFPDGLFGQCYSASSGAKTPTVLSDLDETQLELLRLELTRLSNAGKEWPDQRTQCVLAYFKLSMSYNLQYDSDFCEVRNPANIWALIQLIDIGLNEDPAVLDEPVPVILDDTQYEAGIPSMEEENVAPDYEAEVEEIPEEEIQNILDELQEPTIVKKDQVTFDLTKQSEDATVMDYINNILRGENPDLSKLSNSQLDEVIGRLHILKNYLKNNGSYVQETPEESNGEAEEAIQLDALADKQAMLKKDAEEVGEIDQGLSNTEHKIVKGRTTGVTRVVGNRVYLKVNIKDEEQLYPLVEFLQNTIALPNNLLFDDFQFENGQLSMRISRFEGAKPKNEKRIDTVEGVAQAVYKRRKDIARLSDAEITETGIGIGEESVPVESSERDWIFMPVLGICAFTIIALVAVLAVHMMKNRRHYDNNIQHMAEHIDQGKTGHAYQELCRQRVSQDPAVASGRQSKSSSTSSWNGEDGAQPSIDISTGHVILNFLQDFLSDPSRMEAQWEQIQAQEKSGKTATIAMQNMDKNRTVLPYDENIVKVDSWKGDGADYLNASFIYDDDPSQAMYIAAQTPSAADLAAFWQSVWQHGVCLIVNLSTLEESKQEKTYWPETGAEVHGPFEIHLVSEHIWSDDYLVRSFYLKNLQNSQTRTITQFHYLSWKQDSTPTSPKSLLEFRRKVNKSYRGRSSPVLVHSRDGAGRTGVFCAVDMLCGRLQKGVRQLDVAASVEHLRDQREGMVHTADQFKLIYGCVAQEVNSLLKALPQ